MSKITEPSPEPQYWRSVILAYAKRYGADPELLARVSWCESGYKPEAKNKASSASGIMEFLDSTFKSQSLKYGIIGEKNDPYIQIELAARMIADGGIHHWDASSTCWSK